MDVVPLPREKRADAAAVLARAFQGDPAWQWVFPDARRRAAALPWLFASSFDVTEAELWTTAGPILGVARWMPPGRPPMKFGAALKALVVTPLRLRDATQRFFAYGRAIDDLRRDAVPMPHWYLAGIGVEPGDRGQGIGSALMRPGLEAAAKAGLPCALLTNNERNLSFYRGHGFAVIKETKSTRSGPKAWVLLKNP
jgi:ribosomal protein S18 acetylase RimI-like enzyme